MSNQEDDRANTTFAYEGENNIFSLLIKTGTLPGFLVGQNNAILSYNALLLDYIPHDDKKINISNISSIFKEGVKNDFLEGIDRLKTQTEYLVFPSGLLKEEIANKSINVELFSTRMSKKGNLIVGFLVPEHPNDKEFETNSILQGSNILNIITNFTDTIYLNIKENGDIIQTYNSKEQAQQLGLKSGQIFHGNIYDCLSDSNKDLLKRTIKEAKFGKSTSKLLLSFKIQEHRIWAEVLTITCRQSINNTEKTYCLFIRNVSSYLKQQNELVLFREIFRHSITAIAVLSNKGVYIIQNKAHHELLGYNDTDLIGKTPSIHLGDEKFQEIIQAINDKGYYLGEIQSTTKNGEKKILELSSYTVTNPYQETTYYIGIKKDITEQKASDTEIKQARLRQIAILDNIPYQAWLKDQEGRYIDVNQKYLLENGLKRQQVINKTDFDIWPEDIALKYQADDKTAIYYKKRVTKHETFTNSKGTKKWYEIIKTPIFNSDGTVYGTTGIARDITKEVQDQQLKDDYNNALKILSKASQQLTNLPDETDIYKFIGETILSLSMAFIVAVSKYHKEEKQLKTAYVLTKEQDVLKRIKSVLGPPELLNFDLKEKYAKKIATGKVNKLKKGIHELLFEQIPEEHEKLFRELPLGEIYGTGIAYKKQLYGSVAIIMIKGEKQRHSELINAFIREAAITLQKNKMTEELRESEKKYRRIFESYQDIYFRVNRKGTIMEVSPSVKDISGFHPHDLIGRQGRDFVHMTEESLFDILEKKDKIHDLDVRFAKKDGQFSYGSLNAQLIINPKTNQQEIEGVVRDISDRKKLEEELKEINQTKDKLFSIIAHDLKSPFNSIMGLSELLMQSFDQYPEEEQKELVGYIYETSNNTYTLLMNLLEWAKMQKGQIIFSPEQIQLADLITDSIEPLLNIANRKEISIIHTIDPTIALFADKNMLKTVFRNLIDNAIKFSFSGTKVEINASLGKEDVTIHIRDNGTGMEQEQLGILFQENKKKVKDGTHKEKGTGVGLMLCKEFINAHNGSIKVDSIPEKGTTFHITIPIKQ